MLPVLALLAYVVALTTGNQFKYEPNWESLDSRPIPEWYDEAKFGIFLHWGVYSVPSFQSEWFWWNWKNGSDYVTQRHKAEQFMQQNFRPDFTYADFAPTFTAELFDADRWAELLQNSGAKYVVLTSKHGEGFANWPSKYSWNWNSIDSGPVRDIVGELATAVRRHAPDVHFGLYYCLYSWFHPLYLEAHLGGFKTQEFNRVQVWPHIRELVETYRPEILWSDGDYEVDDWFWNSTDILAWLYNSSPVRDFIVTNDRWGANTNCKHGGYWTCHDKFNPGVLMSQKWENCMTTDSLSWGFRRTMTIDQVETAASLIQSLVSTVSCGGNLLLNVGPTSDGRIVPIFQERLLQLGDWLRVNSEGIYGTKPWILQNDTVTPNIWYTSKLDAASVVPLSPHRLYNPQLHETVVFAFFFSWPSNNSLLLGAPILTPRTRVTLLGYPGCLSVTQQPSGILIDFSKVMWKKLPNRLAWALKFEYLDPFPSAIPRAFRPELVAQPDGKKTVTLVPSYY